VTDALRLMGDLNMRYEDIIRESRPSASPEEIKERIKGKLRSLSNGSV
jgi:hypothetical protein